MTELIYPDDGDAVRLRPCPPWCTLTQHFPRDMRIFADDGFHHDGPEITVPTHDRMSTRGPETVVKVTLRAWTSRLDADPDPGHIDLQLATTEENIGMSVELTPDEARAVASALLELADVAARANAAPPTAPITERQPG